MGALRPGSARLHRSGDADEALPHLDVRPDLLRAGTRRPAADGGAGPAAVAARVAARSRGGRAVSWAAHEFENYFIQKHVGVKVSFVAICIGTFLPDLFTKPFVYEHATNAA